VHSVVEETAVALSRFVSAIGAQEVHYVGHSLGGLVILRMCADYPDERPGRIVLLGPPYGICHVAQRVAQVPLARHLLGQSMEALCSLGPPCPEGREVGVIAGNLSMGIGHWLFPGPPGEDDGTVRVDETYIPGMKDHLVLRVSHMGLVLSSQAAGQVCTFLTTGAFDHGA
jgi:pimeloyl-ACP methyl ester carboxylesterase